MQGEEKREARSRTYGPALRRSDAPAGPCPSGGTQKRPGRCASLARSTG